ncbi:MAG: DUF2029 domain-containing protein [Candidatus Aminicenantes bacterium]|nr:DUF2029 domain-containing protein [Candidatus Aminicenantes bacterium]
MKEILKAIRDYTAKHEKLTAEILLIVCGVMIAYYALKVATTPDIQWDLKLYQSAVIVFFEGGNYYDFELLKEKGSPLPFGYSPYAIFFLLFLGVSSFQKMAFLWLGLKVGVLIALFFIWKKIFYEYFDKRNSWIFFCLFLVWSLRAFNRTIYTDLYAGNISIIEEFLIWSGVLFLLLRGRYLIFGLCLLIASFFKVLPIFLIGLVLVTGTGKIKDRIKKLGIIALISLVVWGAGLLIMPNEFGEWSNFLKSVSFMPPEVGKNNPAILPFIREIIGNGGRALELILYSLWVLTVFLVSFNVSRHISKTDFSSERKEKYLFFLWCFVYPIIMPRFKDYTFIFLLPIFCYSLYEVIKESKKWPLKAIGVLLLAFSFFVMEKENVGILVVDYWPLLITIISWIVFAFFIMKDSVRLQSKKISELTN